MTPLLLLTLSTPWAGSLSGTDAPSQLEQAYKSKRIGVLIGVDHYGDPELDNLAFAGKDARDLAETLERNGNFDESERQESSRANAHIFKIHLQNSFSRKPGWNGLARVK